jgi:hypothetical protein
VLVVIDPREVGLRAVAGIGQDDGRGTLDAGGFQPCRHGRDHGSEGSDVGCLVGDLGGQHHLGALVHLGLGVVGVVQAVGRLHHLRLGVGEVALGLLVRLGH